MNSRDRYFIFDYDSGNIVATSNDYDEIYTKLYNLNKELVHVYLVFDNKQNEYLIF